MEAIITGTKANVDIYFSDQYRKMVSGSIDATKLSGVVTPSLIMVDVGSNKKNSRAIGVEYSLLNLVVRIYVRDWIAGSVEATKAVVSDLVKFHHLEAESDGKIVKLRIGGFKKTLEAEVQMKTFSE